MKARVAVPTPAPSGVAAARALAPHQGAITRDQINFMVEEVAKRVLAALDARLNHAPVRLDIERRLTVKEFAFVIERSEEYVRRQIRGRIIAKELVDGPPYKINARAIKHFAVTPELAAARLALLQQAASPARNRRKAA